MLIGAQVGDINLFQLSLFGFQGPLRLGIKCFALPKHCSLLFLVLSFTCLRSVKIVPNPRCHLFLTRGVDLTHTTDSDLDSVNFGSMQQNQRHSGF